jgi:hypothetical protein
MRCLRFGMGGPQISICVCCDSGLRLEQTKIQSLPTVLESGHRHVPQTMGDDRMLEKKELNFTMEDLYEHLTLKQQPPEFAAFCIECYLDEETWAPTITEFVDKCVLNFCASLDLP